jgi:hypothetical protein
MILSIRGAIAHQLEHRFFHLDGSQMSGVQILGVGSLRERSFRAAAIALVSRFQVAGDVFHRGAQFRGSSLRAGFGLRIEENLHLGFGKHHRPDIAAFHHRRTGCPYSPLFISQRPPNSRLCGYAGSRFAHFRIPDIGRHVLSVEEHEVAGEFNTGFACKLFQAMEIVQVHAQAQSP